MCTCDEQAPKINFKKVLAIKVKFDSDMSKRQELLANPEGVWSDDPYNASTDYSLRPRKSQFLELS